MSWIKEKPSPITHLMNNVRTLHLVPLSSKCVTVSPEQGPTRSIVSLRSCRIKSQSSDGARANKHRLARLTQAQVWNGIDTVRPLSVCRLVSRTTWWSSCSAPAARVGWRGFGYRVLSELVMTLVGHLYPCLMYTGDSPGWECARIKCMNIRRNKRGIKSATIYGFAFLFNKKMFHLSCQT